MGDRDHASVSNDPRNRTAASAGQLARPVHGRAARRAGEPPSPQLDPLRAQLNDAPRVTAMVQLRAALNRRAHAWTQVPAARAAAAVHGNGEPFAARGVVQAWRDHRGKWHDPPPVKPDEAQWESFTDPKGMVAYRPKEGSDAWKADQEAIAAAKEKGARTKAENQARARAWEEKSTDYESVFFEDPAVVLYTQDSISALFANGKSIESMREALESGELAATDVEPIMVQLWKGRLWSYDNRRLWAFKHAGVQVRCRFGSPREIAANKFKLTTGDGKKITIRK
jgi:hypothetical protein